MARSLYLVAYDVCNPGGWPGSRYFHSYRVAGKSQCRNLGHARRVGAHQADLRRLLQQGTDRLQLIALDPRMTPRCMGQAGKLQARTFCVT